MKLVFCALLVLAISTCIFAIPSARERRNDAAMELIEQAKKLGLAGGAVSVSEGGKKGSLTISDGRSGGNSISYGDESGQPAPPPPPPQPPSVNVQTNQVTKVDTQTVNQH